MLDQDERLKKNYDEFYSVIQAHTGDAMPSLTDKESRTPLEKAASPISDLVEGSVLKSDLNKLQHVKCVEQIELSSFNPVPEVRRMAGDLFYLTVRTIENPS